MKETQDLSLQTKIFLQPVQTVSGVEIAEIIQCTELSHVSLQTTNVHLPRGSDYEDLTVRFHFKETIASFIILLI